MYTVIKHFTDLQDKNHPYNVGDDFPREGLKVTKERIAELSSSNNKRREPLITLATSQVKKEEPKEEPKAEVKDDKTGPSENVKSKSGKKKQPKR